MSRPSFRAGVARRDISPDDPHWLVPTGMNRLVPTRGVLDPLFVEALALEAGGELAFIVTSDLRYLPSAWAQELRRRIAQRTGCDPELVLLSSNHNHSSSPEVPNAGLMAQLEGADADKAAATQAALDASTIKIFSAFVESCAAAASELQSAEIAAVSAPVESTIGENRRMRLGNGTCVQRWGAGAVMPPGEKFVGPAGTNDDRIIAICVRAVGAKSPFAVLTSYGAHIHLYEIPYFSGEVGGACKRAIQARIPNSIAMYASGMSGDIDMHCVHPMPAGGEAEHVKWFQESAALLGQRFADAVAPAIASLTDYQQPESFKCEYFSTGEEPDDQRKILVLHTLLLGDIAIATLPGEIFFEFGQRLRTECKAKHLFLMGYNGSDVGYTPTPLGQEQGSYEAMRGPARSAEEELITTENGERVSSRKARPESGAEIVDRLLGMIEGLARP